MKKQLLFITTAFTLSTSLYAQQSNEQANAMLAKTDRQFFIENKGQWSSEVLYLTRIGGLDAWITKKGVLYDFFKLEEIQSSEKTMHELPDKFEHKDYMRIGHRVLYELQNTNASPSPEGKQKQEGYYNYLIGNDPSKHASNVGLYKEALVKNVYNGIDVRYYFDQGRLRYDYIVHPGADPAQIQFSFRGSDKTFINNQGNLVFTTRFGEVKLAELYCYQGNNKKEVRSKFIATNKHYSIQVADYDKSQDLIIDPLIYSTYIGGSVDDYGTSIAIDGSGYAYVTGYTASTNYDITPGAYQTTYGGGTNDVFVTKLNSTGDALIYSTYIGGSSDDYGTSIAIDGSGNAYVTGFTASTNYDITPGAYQTTYGGGTYDVFVTKLNATGTGLVYSTYLGGSNYDVGNSIAIDGSGNAYVVGSTNSTNYDITPGAYQITSGGGDDVFVTKLNATGTSLVYSTYLGGSNYDVGNSIAIDGSGNAYVVGTTTSTNYDITSGAYQTTFGGIYDVFVTKLNATGISLVYSTYIGGSSWDYGNSIAIDSSGNAYVVGSTASTNYDITPGAYQTTNEGNFDVFVTKLNATGTGLVYSTYIGGSGSDGSVSIAIDGSGNAYVVGSTASTNYDITPGAYQTTYGGGTKDVYVTKLNATGDALIYSTYIGGSDDDYGRSIAIDGSGNAYVTGYTLSNDYDITPGAYQTTNAGGNDVFVTKLCLGSTMSATLSSGTDTDNQVVCENTAISTIIYSTTGATGIGTPSGLPTGVTANWVSNVLTISGTPTATGTFNYSIPLTGGCGSVNVTGTITVNPNNTFTLVSPSGTDNQAVCENTAISTIIYSTTGATGIGTPSGLPAGVTASWASNVLTISGTPTATGTFNYSIPLTGGCGTVSATGTITVNVCTGIQEQTSSLTWKIYPNPNKGQFIIKTENAGIFELMDISGKILSTYTITANEYSIQKELPAGMYFIREQKTGAVQKLIIE